MPSLGFTSVPPLLKYLLYAEQLGIATAPALAAAIVRLLDEPQLAARLGQAARGLAEERCGEALMLDRMEAIFRRFGRAGAR